MSESNGTAKRLSVLAVVEQAARKEGAKPRTRWVKVGVGWPNRDGSINLYLDAFPVGTNKLQIREEEVAEASRNGSAEDDDGAASEDAAEARP